MRKKLIMPSDDEVRDVVITEFDDCSCLFQLNSEGFCQLEVSVNEDIFELSKKQLRTRPYMVLVNHFLGYGIEDKSYHDVKKLLKSNKLDIDYSIEMMFKNTLNIQTGLSGIDSVIVSMEPYEDGYADGPDEYEKVPYGELANLSVSDVFYKFSGWSASELLRVIRHNVFYGCNVNYAYVDGIYLFMYDDILNTLENNEYLRKVDFINTHKVLKLDNVTEDVTKKLNEASQQSKMIILTHIHEDGTPEFMFP